MSSISTGIQKYLGEKKITESSANILGLWFVCRLNRVTPHLHCNTIAVVVLASNLWDLTDDFILIISIKIHKQSHSSRLRAVRIYVKVLINRGCSCGQRTVSAGQLVSTLAGFLSALPYFVLTLPNSLVRSRILDVSYIQLR